MFVPIIYIDVLFAVNLLVNYILLRASATLSRIKENKFRVFLGAFIGALYAVLVFFPDFSVIYSTLFKMLVSMLIIACSFAFYSIRGYLKTLFVFYIVSFGFGGCVLGVFYFSDIGAKLGAVYSNGILYFNLPWTVLALAGFLFYISTKIFAYFSRKALKFTGLRKKLYISFENNTAELTALMDTGNSLVDPITLSPVIIAEYKPLKSLFNKEVRCSLDQLEKGNITWIMSDIVQKGIPARLIPFTSLGKSNGMLIGFVPDKAEIHDNCGVRVLDKCVIGIYNKSLSKDRSYSALLNPYM